MNLHPQNILLIHFGQLGDVVMSLPALKAVREKFPAAKITALVGKPAVGIVKLTDFFEDEIVVDRVELRDGKKLASIKEILKLVSEVRKRKFDFVIDLHSLPETNLLGFLSGAKLRLYANRENRSLDWLGKFPVKSPLEDKSKRLREKYFDALIPLEIVQTNSEFVLQPRSEDLRFVKDLLERKAVSANAKLVGLFPGAGNPNRRWSLEKFAALAKLLTASENAQPLVILGPEESGWAEKVVEMFPPETVVVEHLSLAQLIAALSLLRVLVSNDTGVIHLGAAVGAPLVLIIENTAPQTYLPMSEKVNIVRTGTISEIGVAEVYEATGEFLR